MNCGDTEYAILEGRLGTEGERHLRSCESCRQFRAAQAEIDSLCQRAFRPPELSPAFRHTLDARVGRERARPSGFVAPAVGLVCTALCTWLGPDVGRIGLGLSLLAYLAPFAFEWLTEELGEA